MANDLSSPTRDFELVFAETIETQGIRVPFVPEIVTPAIERPLRNGRYVTSERLLLAEILRPDDRVLDLGGGLGIVSAFAARLVTEGRVLCVEAQPNLLPMIHATWELNGVERAELRHGAVTRGRGADVPFYIRRHFWASSGEPDSRPFREVRQVPSIAIGDLIREFRPTVICCDIEGAELDLFESADLHGVRAIVIETHPKVYGEDARDGLVRTFAAKGLLAREQDRPSTVHVLEREDAAMRTRTLWPPADPRVLVATCMKNEGPFVLEWLAWHKAVGVTDFVVFTNDCTDGTDALLDHLDARRDLIHLTNPAVTSGSTFFQPAALSYVQTMPVFRRADFFLSMDVDEFLNVRVGDGTIGALLGAVEPFDVLSVCELNHGSNGRQSYERGWVTELFPAHGAPRTGKWRARAGVKSLTHLGPRIAGIRNHRPDLAPESDDAVWLDGSGKRMSDLAEAPGENGVDSRGRRELVSLEHYPLRSLESFLVKMHRGDVVVDGKSASLRYWRLRDRAESTEMDIAAHIARARQAYAAFESDARLMELHEACCAAHEARIADLLTDDAFRQRREEILALTGED